jgi:hypothetical protein
MPTTSQPAGSPAELARRLRDLRLRRWPGRNVTQLHLAQAFGRDKALATSLISGWEKGTSIPPESRLYEYATFFVTDRSIADGRGRLLPDAELTDAEATARTELFEELRALRTGAATSSATSSITADFSTWTMPVDEDIRIVCGKLDPPGHPYTEEGNPNYTETLTTADGDSLLELFGHLRKFNPGNDVRFIRSDRLRGRADSADDLASHLVLLGGIGLNVLAESTLQLAGLPIRQKNHPKFRDRGEVFEVTAGPEKGKEFLPIEVDGVLLEDVGLFARAPNPYNSSRTLTVCNGVFAKGVLGAVRCLTDDKLRVQNETYLASRFGGADRFAILMRVPVRVGAAQTPDLQIARTRLYEWRDDAVPADSSGLERAG